MLQTQPLKDILLSIPIVGEVFDVANAIMYACEKDYLNAVLSAGAIIPMVGSLFFKGGEYGFKIMKGFKFDASKAVKFKKTTKITANNLGIIKIDLDKVPKELINKSYNAFPLYDELGKRSLAYQYSV